jgi:hypothetical protein
MNDQDQDGNERPVAPCPQVSINFDDSDGTVALFAKPGWSLRERSPHTTEIREPHGSRLQTSLITSENTDENTDESRLVYTIQWAQLLPLSFISWQWQIDNCCTEKAKRKTYISTSAT